MEIQPAKVEYQPLVGIERALGIEQLHGLHSTCKNITEIMLYCTICKSYQKMILPISLVS
jgi:hypothetical protein